MVQFTLGCILIALSLFFGMSEIMSNKDIVDGRERELKTETARVEGSKKIKTKFEGQKEEVISYSADLRTNLLNQLNIDEGKYDFDLVEPKNKKQVLVSYNYSIKGYDGYTNVISLLGDIEKIKGLFVDDICLNCMISTEKRKRDKKHLSFKIEGTAYVYNEK